MKFAFLGTSGFAVAILEKLLSDFYYPELVITQPDRPVGRKQVLTPPPVKDICSSHQLTCLQPENIQEIAQQLKGADLDFLIVAEYGQILPQTVLDTAKSGAINVHASLLPRHRGASPIQGAILAEDEQTGISIMKMDARMDHGAVYFQYVVDIAPTDSYQSLHAKLAHVGAEVLTKTLPDITKGKLSAKEQDHERATFTKIVKKDDARVDWDQPARDVDRQIRAYYDRPIAWTTLPDDTRLKIMNAQMTEKQFDVPAGTLLFENDDAFIQTSDYALKLEHVQVQGKKPANAADFARGYKRFDRQKCG